MVKAKAYTLPSIFVVWKNSLQFVVLVALFSATDDILPVAPLNEDVDPIDDGGPGVTVIVGANFHDPKECLTDAILDAASGAIDASGLQVYLEQASSHRTVIATSKEAHLQVISTAGEVAGKDAQLWCNVEKI